MVPGGEAAKVAVFVVPELDLVEAARRQLRFEDGVLLTPGLAQQPSPGADAASRGQTYRESGWQAFDQDASPYTADEAARERTHYGEDR